MGKQAIDYRALDATIAHLVHTLNAFEGVTTIGSCGGHDQPGPGQWPAGSWYVTFRIARDAHGWRALEFLAFCVETFGHGRGIILRPSSPPPYLNTPGRMLRFALECYDGMDPNELAAFIDTIRNRCYIPPKRKSDR